MYWFKNALIYRLTKSLDWKNINEQLKDNAFHPCGDSDYKQSGWSAPLKDCESLTYQANGQILILFKSEEKILPVDVVKRELDERIELLEQKENRKLTKTEKLALKDDVVMNLLPRAFSKQQHTALWIDTGNNLIYVDAASSKRAEDALALLRKSLGSLPVLPLTFANEPRTILTQWIADDDTVPDWLTVLDEAVIHDKYLGIAHCKKKELNDEEVIALANNGYVTKLAVEWEENVKFILNDDCTLKRLKFADNVIEKNDDIYKEDFAQRFDADFMLMTSVLSKLTDKLLKAFGGVKTSAV